MQISVLVTAYQRPAQLREALASIAAQDPALVGEVLVGDDSPRAFWADNQAAIAASGLSKVQYLPSDPPRGTYPNQWFLARKARCSHLLILHDDDHLLPGALATLAEACAAEADPRVKVWFGRQLLMDEHGQVDPAGSTALNRSYGRSGSDEARPVWQWCFDEAVPSNSFLIARDTYLQYAEGSRDGNVGDWGLMVRLANGGAWARFIAHELSSYRVQANSVTNSGRGVDVHRWHELARQLQVPPEAQQRKEDVLLKPNALVVVTRYARDSERGAAWRCFISPNVSWRQRLSKRGIAVFAMLLMPGLLWRWALRTRN